MTLHDGSERSVEFLMIHSAAGEWFINDIIYPHQKSLRVVLSLAGRSLTRRRGALATRERSAAASSWDARRRRAQRRPSPPACPRLAQGQRATHSASRGWGGCIEPRSSGLRME
jgi:hypothetical protein